MRELEAIEFDECCRVWDQTVQFHKCYTPQVDESNICFLVDEDVQLCVKSEIMRVMEQFGSEVIGEDVQVVENTNAGDYDRLIQPGDTLQGCSTNFSSTNGSLHKPNHTFKIF